jgi:hypothetical protein
MKSGVFWDVTPCGSCKNRCFGGTLRLLHQSENAAVVLGTSDCNKEIATLLQDKAYTKLKKNPMESIEHKTVLQKKSPFSEEVCQQVFTTGFQAN